MLASVVASTEGVADTQGGVQWAMDGWMQSRIEHVRVVASGPRKESAGEPRIVQVVKKELLPLAFPRIEGGLGTAELRQERQQSHQKSPASILLLFVELS